MPGTILTPVCYYALFIASIHNALERTDYCAIINNITVICIPNTELIHLFYVVAVHNILVKVNKLLVVYITKGKFCGIWSMATYQPRKFSLNLPGFARVKCIVLLKYIYVRFFLMLQESSACYE